MVVLVPADAVVPVLAVVVEFRIKPGHIEAFDEAIRANARASVANAIVGLAGNYDAFSTAVTNTALLPSTTGSTWTSNNDGSSSFTLAGTVEGNVGAGASGTALDLYRILNTTSGASPTGTVGVGSWEGTFTISNGGVVGFAVAAVPEPSRALLAGLGLAGVAFRRRRTVKKSA